MDDAVQCGAEVFSRCLRYCEARGGEVDNPRWFMRLFKLALVNEFNTYATRCGRIREADRQLACDQAHTGNDVDHNLGTVGAAVAQASEELQMVLRAVAEAPAELLRLMLAEADDNQWSRRLCRLCRIGKISDGVVAEMRQLFTEGP